MRRRSFLAILAVAPLAACTGDDGPGVDEGNVGFKGGDGSVSIVPVAERQKAPELSGETLDGERLSTADFAGQMLVLNVWGSWCAPCRKEMPELVEASQQLPEVQFIGLNTRDLDPAPAQAFVRAFEVPFPSIHDPKGELLLGFGQLPPKAIPSTLVVDEEGRVAARILGALTASTLAGVIEDVKGAA